MSVESINSSSFTSVTSSQTPSTEMANKTQNNLLSETRPGLANEAVKDQVEKLELEGAVTKLNDFMQNSPQRNLSFSIDESTQELVVVVTDKLTDEVIRQMPTKEALAVAKQIESMLGLILNDKA